MFLFLHLKYFCMFLFASLKLLASFARTPISSLTPFFNRGTNFVQQRHQTVICHFEKKVFCFKIPKGREKKCFKIPKGREREADEG